MGAPNERGQPASPELRAGHFAFLCLQDPVFDEIIVFVTLLVFSLL